MLKKTVILLLSALLLMALAPGCAKSDGNANFGNAIGNKAYDFSLPDVNNNTVTLSSFRGRPVMINFWSAA